MWALKWFTTFLGVGYVRKGGGTIAAFIVCILWIIAAPRPNHFPEQISLVLVVTAAGIWASGKMEPEWGKDSNRIVIDEVAGMAVALLGFAPDLPRTILAFALFRFFDIVKPLFIRRLERLPGGWGVMMDDLLAGLYSNLILQFFVAVNRI